MMQEFAQQVEETARAVTDEIHTAMPGIVLEFEPESCTAMVQPNGKYVTADGNILPYPQMTEVPVVFPFSPSVGAGIVFPVMPGDNCIIIVSEVELDEWRTGAEAEGSLRFDLTSAMCIPGLLREGGETVAEACNERAVVIRAGESRFKVNEERIILSAGDTEMIVSEAGIAVWGDLKVTGNISSTETVKAGTIDLKEHVQECSEPGHNSGKAE